MKDESDRSSMRNVIKWLYDSMSMSSHKPAFGVLAGSGSRTKKKDKQK